MSASLPGAALTALNAEPARAQSAGVDRLLLEEVMEGHYAPHLALTPLLVVAQRRQTSLPIDVHLEAESPDTILQALAWVGAGTFIVDSDALGQLSATDRAIRSRRTSVSPAMDRDEMREGLKHMSGDIDLLVFMAVAPGFEGQRLDPGIYPESSRLERDETWLVGPWELPSPEAQPEIAQTHHSPRASIC